jgi:long-subunit fatty acid transport protein
MTKHKTTKTLLVIAIIALITAATYAFTASNTFSGGNAGSAGSGSGAISGYAISNIHYTNLGTNFATVTFDLDKAASHVEVSFDGGSTVTNCGASSGGSNTVTCSVSDAITPAVSLDVVALS